MDFGDQVHKYDINLILDLFYHMNSWLKWSIKYIFLGDKYIPVE
jgi:hypothetical protein